MWYFSFAAELPLLVSEEALLPLTRPAGLLLLLLGVGVVVGVVAGNGYVGMCACVIGGVMGGSQSVL